MSSTTFNRVEIDLAALRENYTNIQEWVGPSVRVMSMVKADAYGHGLVRCAKTLADAGARVFGVAEVDEGIALREAGVEGDIIVTLGAPENCFADVVRHRLTPVVFDIKNAAGLSAAAAAHDARIGVHLKVDVGMGRFGILPHELASFLREIKRLKGIFPAGILSHFPMSDDSDQQPTMRQLEEFLKLLDDIHPLVSDGSVIHIANSAALLRYPETHLDMVRPGISLYGCYPADDDKDKKVLSLRPVMSFKTSVVQVKEVPEGFGISYGHRFITKRQSRLAVLPVGYDDGFLRKLTNRAEVLVRGCRAKVLGTVCMNACVVDITDIPDAQPGDEVVLMGRQQGEEITADEIAAWMETINYEVVCLFGGMNRRVFLNDKSTTERTD